MTHRVGSGLKSGHVGSVGINFFHEITDLKGIHFSQGGFKLKRAQKKHRGLLHEQ